MIVRKQISMIRNIKLCSQFGERTLSDIKIPYCFTVGLAFVSFGDIAWNTNSRAMDLFDQAVGRAPMLVRE